MKDPNSFYKVVHKGKSGKRWQRVQQNEGQQVTWNQFQVLEEDEEKIVENQANKGSI